MSFITKSFSPALVLLLTSIVFFLLFTKPQDSIISPPDQNSEIYLPTLSLDPQEPSGSITVSSATLDKPGFIAAFKTMDKNIPDGDNFSGVTGLMEGKNENIEIPLREASKEGETYSVIIHVDDGDGIFEYPGDDLPSTFKDATLNYVRITIATPSSGLETPKQ
jgi:hypothetical protein